MPNCNLQSIFDVLGECVPVHVLIAILGNPKDERQLIVTLGDERKVQRSGFSNKDIRFYLLKMC